MDISGKVFSLIEQLKKIEYDSPKPSAIKTKFAVPLFKLLGWDFSNKKNKNTPSPEIIEIKNDSLISKDYLFQINGKYRFYLLIIADIEAEPNENPNSERLHHFCRNANISLGIIMDLKRLSIFDCLPQFRMQSKPVFSFEYTRLVNEWEKFYNIFSKDAFYRNSFNEFKKIMPDIDSVYFMLAKDLLNWHKTVYKNIHDNYPDLARDDINLTVTRFINRLLFLRICEARRLEPLNTLSDLLSENNIYKLLILLFQKADEKYNSGLFHFQKESNRSDPSIDSISFTILIEDQIIKNIIENLYCENPGYDFSIIPADIIGQAYDIYLNQLHVINYDTENETEINVSNYSHPAIIEFIVRKTIGHKTKGKSPGKKSVNSIKILDLCCGSGLFLLESYHFFYNFYLKHYYEAYLINKDLLAALPIFEDENGLWQLSWKERIRILLNHIYGVDINKIAVETASFVLLLKLIEGINKDNIADQPVLFREHALPDLNNNIKCGNALIESDLFRLQQFANADNNIKKEINTFNWQNEFHSITSTGGFNVILGKPPINFIKSFSQKTKPYIKQHYTYFLNSEKPFLLFYEKAFKLLKPKGYLGYVVSENWLVGAETKNLHHEFWIREAININTCDISKKTFEALITIVKKQPRGETTLSNVDNVDFENSAATHVFKDLHFVNLNFFFGNLGQYTDSELTKKIETCSNPLILSAKPYSGYSPYEIGKGIAPEGGAQTAETIKTKPYHSPEKLNENWKTEIVGSDLTRYCLKIYGMRWVKYGHWLAAPRNAKIFNNDRILIHERISAQNGRIESSVCRDEVYHGRDIISIIPTTEFPDILYLLGIINSKLINWYFLVTNSNNRGIFPKLNVSNLSDIPIRTFDIDKSQIKYLCREMIALVKRNLTLNQKKLEVKTIRDTATMEQLIYNIDKQIDAVVYSLYDLSSEQIEIIEDCFGK